MARKIIPLYANEDNGIYGDVFNSPEDVLAAYPGATILKGFGIMDTDTGYLADDSLDFYRSENEAVEDMVNF